MKDYKKYYLLPATPQEVYIAITNPLTISIWTDQEAEMNTEVGSEFFMMDGDIAGKNLAFEENKMVMQEWYFGDNKTPSIVTIKIHENEGGSSVELRHTNIPDEAFDDIVKGWNSAYFGSLQNYFR